MTRNTWIAIGTAVAVLAVGGVAVAVATSGDSTAALPAWLATLCSAP